MTENDPFDIESRGGAIDPEAQRQRAILLAGDVDNLRRDLVLIADPVKRAAVIERMGNLLTKIGRLTGHTLTERAILDSPPWKNLRDCIVETLAPYPEALAALEAELSRRAGAP